MNSKKKSIEYEICVTVLDTTAAYLCHRRWRYKSKNAKCCHWASPPSQCYNTEVYKLKYVCNFWRRSIAPEVPRLSWLLHSGQFQYIKRTLVAGWKWAPAVWSPKTFMCFMFLYFLFLWFHQTTIKMIICKLLDNAIIYTARTVH
jgi:hypothetical protein